MALGRAYLYVCLIPSIGPGTVYRYKGLDRTDPLFNVWVCVRLTSNTFLLFSIRIYNRFTTCLQHTIIYIRILFVINVIFTGSLGLNHKHAGQFPNLKIEIPIIIIASAFLLLTYFFKN